MNLPLITASAEIKTAPAYAAPPRPPYTYLGIAQALLQGVHTLAGASPHSGISLAHLSAHAAECALKAFLSRDGLDTRLKAEGLRHNLVALWSATVCEGLAVAHTPPSWLTVLSQLHDRPYHLRYSTGINGIVTPSPQPMVTELEALVTQVAKQLGLGG